MEGSRSFDALCLLRMTLVFLASKVFRIDFAGCSGGFGNKYWLSAGFVEVKMLYTKCVSIDTPTPRPLIIFSKYFIGCK